jgi:hypothetical protein
MFFTLPFINPSCFQVLAIFWAIDLQIFSEYLSRWHSSILAFSFSTVTYLPILVEAITEQFSDKRNSWPIANKKEINGLSFSEEICQKYLNNLKGRYEGSNE